MEKFTTARVPKEAHEIVAEYAKNNGLRIAEAYRQAAALIAKKNKKAAK